jgi:Flp pilus assembly protein TadD
MAHFRVGNDDEAIRCWSRLRELEPKDARYEPWLERAKRRKAVREELARVEAQVRDSPDDAKLHAQAGRLLGKLGQWPKAAEALAKAVGLAPDAAATRKAYGIALFRAGKMDDAVAQLEACAKLDPENPEYPRLIESLKRLRSMHKGMGKGHGHVPSHGAPRKGDSQK